MVGVQRKISERAESARKIGVEGCLWVCLFGLFFFSKLNNTNGNLSVTNRTFVISCSHH